MENSDQKPVASTAKRKFRSRIVIFLSVFCLLAAIIFFAIPLGTKWYLQKWLIDNGADVAVIEKLKINPFTGELTLLGADVQRGGQVVFSDQTIYLNLDLTKLLNKEANLASVKIADALVNLEQAEDGRLRVASYNLPEEDRPIKPIEVDQVPWIFYAQHIDLSQVTVQFKRPDLNLHVVIEAGSITRFGTRLHEKEGELKLKGTINGAPFSIDTKATSPWPELKLNGHISLANLDLEMVVDILKEVVDPLAGLVGLDGDIALEIGPEQDTLFDYDGTLSLDSSVAGGKDWVVKGSYQWDGKINLMKPQDNKGNSISIGGSLNGQQIAADLTAAGIIADIGAIAVQDISSQDLRSFSIGSVHLVDPVVTEKETKQQLAALHSLAVNAIQMTGPDNVAIQNIKASQGSFLKPEHQEEAPLATLKEMAATTMQWSVENGFSCDLITLDSAFASFVRKKSDSPEASSKEKQEPEKETAATSTENREAAGMPVKIDRIDIVGESGFSFTDTSLTTKFSTELKLETAQIKDINLNKPEQPFTYLLKGAFDKYAPFTAEGSCAPLAAELSVKNKSRLRNYPLQKLSPYVVDAIGTYFESGQLDITSEMEISGDNIDVLPNLVFKDLSAKTVDENLAEKLDNALPVPLDMALSMLKDSSGNIDLDVPISGKLSDINIDFTDIIVTAMGKAVAVSVAPYLAYTVLGPTGALVFLGTQLGTAMLSTDLPTISFQPGQKELTEAQLKTLGTVGKAIKEDPKNQYSICARVALSELGDQGNAERVWAHTVQDEEARKELFRIGETRSIMVQKYLMETFAIDAEQLSLCNPGFNVEEGALTTIEFRQ